MKNKANVACRIFKEQIDLINQLPEEERAIVLYRVINDCFNQIENQIDFSDLGKVVYNLLHKNIVTKEFSNNYGGARKGAGRPISAVKNQIENQIENQNKNQIENQNENAYVSVSVSDNISGNNNSRKDTSSLSTTHVSKFTPPTENEVLEYAKQQNDMAGMGGLACTEEQAQDFYDYYSGIGWKLPNDAQTPILDWKPFFRKWIRNPKYKNEPQKDPNDEAYEADCRFLARRKREREEAARNGGIK